MSSDCVDSSVVLDQSHNDQEGKPDVRGCGCGEKAESVVPLIPKTGMVIIAIILFYCVLFPKKATVFL